MKKVFATRSTTTDADFALLLVRLVTGAAFMIHGWGKIQNPMGWMGPDAAIPGIFLALAAIAEFGGGLALILGFLTRLGAFGIACTMVVAVGMHAVAMGDPFVNPTGGRSYELALVFLSIAILLMILGPGRISLDRKVFGVRA